MGVAAGAVGAAGEPSSDITPDNELTSEVCGRLAPGVRRSAPNSDSAAPTASLADA